MKQIIVILVLIYAQFTLAFNTPELRKQVLEGKTDCNGSVSSSEQYAYYANRNNLKVLEISTGKEISNIDAYYPITSIKTYGDQLFILTEYHLEVRDLAGKKQDKILSWKTNFSYYEQPRGMDITESKIYIAHGIHGIDVIDRNTYNQVSTISVKSVARDIAIHNDKAVVVLDNNTEGGFHGFAIVDLNSNQVTQYKEFENVFPESVSILGDTLLVGFFSTIWKYRTDDVFTQSSPKVVSRVYNFPAGFGTIIDKAFYDEKNMYACYEARDVNGENPQKKIVVFDRQQLGL